MNEDSFKFLSYYGINSGNIRDSHIFELQFFLKGFFIVLTTTFFDKNQRNCIKGGAKGAPPQYKKGKERKGNQEKRKRREK